METNNKIAQKELLQLAKKKAKKRRDYYIHLMVYAVGIIFWLLKNYTEVPVNFWPLRYINWFVMAIWTFAVVIQTVELLVSELLFGRKWEEKKLGDIMKEKSETKKWE